MIDNKVMIRTRQQGDTPFFPNMLNNGKVEVCLKADVDKVIAELEGKLHNVSGLIKETMEWLIESQKLHKRCVNNAVKIIRHHKYKRCMAAAKWCEIGAQFQHNIVMQFDNPFYIKRAEWLEKWRNRWLKMAEQFKEAD